MKTGNVRTKIECMVFLLLLFCLGQLCAAECGDTNSSGVIDIVDALLIAQYYVGLNPANFDSTAADVDGNNDINIVDALLIAQYYVGLIASLDGCIQAVTPDPTPGPTAIPAGGSISIYDTVPGWASLNGGTTGGGTNLGGAVTVNSMSALQSAAGGSGGRIILVEPGNYSGTLSPGANKTIIGKAPGVTIRGNISISGSDKYNIILRNLAVRGNTCGSYDECKSGPDAVYIGNGAHNIWLDHLDIADGQDGNCDITKEGDYVTISWSKFHYTYNKEHRFSNLIAGSDDETQSRNKLQITYMNCWWGDRVEQRQPRGRFGKIHLFNNFHSSKATGQYCAGPGVEIAMIIENCFYDVSSGTPAIKADFGTPKGWRATGNEGNAVGMNSQQGSVFTIPYGYTAIPASQVRNAVTASAGGAGNTCQLRM
ncbi:MAG: hypothetical protein JXJ04_07575 [Spirochaetales bacterium]|nr:hypothetical protein [Spirochaetales bacterium]